MPDADYLARFVASAGLDRASIDCGDPFTRASLTVNFAALEATTDALDATLIDAAERNAIRAAEHRLSCNPLDGNAWLRYAMVQTRGRGPAASAIDALARVVLGGAERGLDHRAAFGLCDQPPSGRRDRFRDGISGRPQTLHFLRVRPAGSPRPMSRCLRRCARCSIRLIDAQAGKRKRAIVAEIDRLGVDYWREAQ